MTTDWKSTNRKRTAIGVTAGTVATGHPPNRMSVHEERRRPPPPSTTPQRRRLRRRRRWIRAAAAVVALLLLTAYARTAAAETKNDMVHVVNIHTDRSSDPVKCPIKCTGTLITDVMVLTAASCTEQEQTDDDGVKRKPATTTAAGPSKGNYKRTGAAASGMTAAVVKATTSVSDETNGVAVRAGSIRVYLSLPVSKFERYVARKFLNPEWNLKTKVADLVLLRLNSHFPGYSKTPMHNIMDNDMHHVPTNLSFKGFGKINLTLNLGEAIDDVDSKRVLYINFTNKLCPSIINDRVSKNDSNWWSFLCTTGDHVRTDVENTLCSEDVGGPLYVVEHGLARLYGVFSHAFHVKYPFCATQLCYDESTAPFPCNAEPGLLFYKHTALIGRYAYWINQTVERESRAPTEPSTCPTSEPTGTNDDATTMDPDYDVDVYSDRRLVVANYKVCPKHRASSAAVAATASAAVAVFAALAAR